MDGRAPPNFSGSNPRVIGFITWLYSKIFCNDQFPQIVFYIWSRRSERTEDRKSVWSVVLCNWLICSSIREPLQYGTSPFPVYLRLCRICKVWGGVNPYSWIVQITTNILIKETYWYHPKRHGSVRCIISSIVIFKESIYISLSLVSKHINSHTNWMLHVISYIADVFLICIECYQQPYFMQLTFATQK